MNNPWKVSTLMMGAALAFVVGTGQISTASADEQPVMQTALQNLEAALEALKKADQDKGGHRAKAVDLTKKAIEQVKKGIDFDNKHAGKAENKKAEKKADAPAAQ